MTAKELLQQRGKLEAQAKAIQQQIKQANKALSRYILAQKLKAQLDLKELAKRSKIKETTLLNYVYGNNIIPESAALSLLDSLNKAIKRKQKHENPND